MENKKPTAILISAGAARRMYPLTVENPKCLIKIHNDFTILDFQIKALIKAGIEQVKIIIGFQAQKIIDYVAEKNYLIDIDFILNPFYAVSNNLASLWLALKEIDEPVITINGDDIFCPEIIRKLCKNKKDFVLTFSQKAKYDEDDMKVQISSKEGLLKIGKGLSLELVNGESIGIIKYSKEGLRCFNRVLQESVLKDNANINKFYLSAIQALVDTGFFVDTFEVNPTQWCEFDYIEDIETFKHGASFSEIVFTVLSKQENSVQTKQV